MAKRFLKTTHSWPRDVTVALPRPASSHSYPRHNPSQPVTTFWCLLVAASVFDARMLFFFLDSPGLQPALQIILPVILVWGRGGVTEEMIMSLL